MSTFVRSSEGNKLVVSSLLRVEVASAISRLRKGDRLLPAEAIAALDFLTDAIERMAEKPLTPAILHEPSMLGNLHSLRALDAIHLASAVALRSLVPQEEMRFVCSDNELLEAARKEGFATWNPCDGRDLMVHL